MKSSKFIKYTLVSSMMCSFAVANLVKITVDPFENQNPTSFLMSNPKAITNTQIIVKAGYPTHILAGQWKSLVQDNFGNWDEVKLSEFLDLSSVPPGVGYTITEYSANLVTGKITFNITSDKHYNNGVLVDSASAKFPIALNLTPQVTKFAIRSAYPPILVNKIEAQLFGENDKVKMNNFRQYVEITAPVAGAILYLLPGSFSIKETTGVAKFSVYYDKYYDGTGAEKTQTSSSISQKFDVTLNLLPLATQISSLDSHPQDLRVDKLLPLITDANGILINQSLWSQYIEVANVPDGATLKVTNVNTSDYHLGVLSFDIEVSKYIDENSVIKTNGLFPIQLQLLAKFEPTSIILKPSGSYDDTIRVDRLIPLFVANPNANQEGVVTNRAELSKFVNIVSLPTDAILSIVDVNKTNATGLIKFSIEASQYYNADSDLILTPFKFPIQIQLVPKYNPSVIEAKLPADITEVVRVDRFLDKFCNPATGVITDLSYLQNFINISGDFGPSNVFSIKPESINIQPALGTITFAINASSYYDVDSDLRSNGIFTISLTLQVVNPPTYAKALNSYSKDLTVSEFKSAMPTEQVQMRAFLSKFVDGISTFPSTANLSIEWDAALEDPTTGAIGFFIVTDFYYDQYSDPVNKVEKFKIELTILPLNELPSETVVDLLPKAPPIKSLKDLLGSILKDDKVDYANFTQYFDIASVPTNAEIEVRYSEADLNNRYSVNFIVTVTEYYDKEGQNIKSQKDFPFSIRIYSEYPVYTSDFEGWWLALGIIGLILLTTVTYVGLLNRQALYELVLMRIKNSRRLK